MSKAIELVFDFVSPNAYLIWQPLKALAAKYDAHIEIIPVFLGGMHKLTGNAPPFIRDAEVKGKNAYAMLELQRFVKKHQLTKWQMNPHFPFSTITLQRMLLAVEPDQRIALIDTLLPPIWENQFDVTDVEGLGKILADNGFDPQDLVAKTQDPEIKQQLIDNVEKMVERGAFGIPTIYIEGEMYFGKERLGQIEEQLAG
ncbi:MAG: 2-hydroxychromene-2-carboxylate isomerase [Parasphingorhabdus sp.]|uniref:2-hydroxychromene-2-carboxylate isomerase n=1 Tax=Parasphingorhabdus sp. TaxID=2709688 RepID=UPI0032985DA4